MGEKEGTQGGKKAQPGERWGLGDHTNGDDAGKDNIGWFSSVYPSFDSLCVRAKTPFQLPFSLSLPPPLEDSGRRTEPDTKRSAEPSRVPNPFLTNPFPPLLISILPDSLGAYPRATELVESMLQGEEESLQ
ncbi:hypothetical protein DFH94DRAFT_678269 [Russula ochroleuca]|uniref:Uncharacterized protein n=1 Tax=Russula ochroleuca TaxID=152965 RepID=A0A9P5N676_9AGAM|nr:hypothetical protein DFH94DRAFT_678269 [Russula ochroleuca]